MMSSLSRELVFLILQFFDEEKFEETLHKLEQEFGVFLNMKLQFPNLRRSRLRTLINQSLNWQHDLCCDASPYPSIETLYVDHSCQYPNRAWAPSPANNSLLGIKEGAVKMSSLSKQLVFLILQFLNEEKFRESNHKLEQESGVFFNMKYFEDEVHNGNWDEVEKYLSGFTKVEDNRCSMKMFFEIKKQKYLEALDKHDRSKAVDILVKDLKIFATFNEELFKEIAQLSTLENFGENEQLSKYGDTKSARAIMLVELKKLIEANPLFHDKLQFPNLKSSRLRTLINQGTGAW
ncbi:topless-related protein 1-like [Malus sylvestris]|uniref:topless-related protein 1-like n=1 Tax=Malus sylvestris TaxID=3752 RepID=UPI0021AC0559|nr:topless-related protein 1-like [Malus sylvestris]